MAKTILNIYLVYIRSMTCHHKLALLYHPRHEGVSISEAFIHFPLDNIEYRRVQLQDNEYSLAATRLQVWLHQTGTPATEEPYTRHITSPRYIGCTTRSIRLPMQQSTCKTNSWSPLCDEAKTVHNVCFRCLPCKVCKMASRISELICLCRHMQAGTQSMSCHVLKWPPMIARILFSPVNACPQPKA
jgi:hypothetical protein